MSREEQLTQVHTIELTQEKIDSVIAMYEIEFNGPPMPPRIPPFDFDRYGGGENGGEPARTKRLQGVLRMLATIVTRPFCIWPEDAPLHMSDYYDPSKKY